MKRLMVPVKEDLPEYISLYIDDNFKGKFPVTGLTENGGYHLDVETSSWNKLCDEATGKYITINKHFKEDLVLNLSERMLTV